MRKSPLKETPQPLSQLLAAMKLKLDQVDYIIVGDGSGTTWEKAIGWAATVIDCHTFQREPIFGFSNHGTNIVAELKAYTEALEWLVEHAKLMPRAHGTRVHCVSDCEHLSQSWNNQQLRKKNRERWHLFESYSRRGLKLFMHWIPRAIFDLNIFADQLAGNCRLAQGTLLETTLKQLGKTDVSQINPFDE